MSLIDLGYSDISGISSAEPSEDLKREGLEYMGTFPVLMNILNTLTGAEILGVPNSMTLCGFSISVSLMTFTAVLSYIATIMIIKLQNSVQAESINDMATKIIGRIGGQAFSSLTLLFTYSCQVAYLIIGSDTLCSWLHLLGLDEWTVGWKRAIVVLIYSLLIPVALSIPRKLTILSTASTAAIGCQVLFVISMIYKAATILPVQGIHPTCETAKFGIVFYNAFAIYSMLYAFPAVVLPLVAEYPPDLGKRYKLMGMSFMCCFTIILIPSVLGYLMFGANSEQIIFSSFPHNDVLIQVCRMSFFLVVNASFPVVSITVMTDISSIIYGEHEPTKLSWKKRALALFISDAPPVLIAMVLPNVRPVFEIGGALGGCISNFFFPPLLWFVQSHKPWYSVSQLAMIAFTIFGLVSAVIATYQAVIDAMTELE